MHQVHGDAGSPKLISKRLRQSHNGRIAQPADIPRQPPRQPADVDDPPPPTPRCMCGTAAFAHCTYPTTLVLMSLEQESSSACASGPVTTPPGVRRTRGRWRRWAGAAAAPRAIRRPARARRARSRCSSAPGPGWTASEAPRGCSRPGRSAPRARTPEESRRAE